MAPLYSFSLMPGVAGSSADMADVGLTGTALRAGEVEFSEEG